VLDYRTTRLKANSKKRRCDRSILKSQLGCSLDARGALSCRSVVDGRSHFRHARSSNRSKMTCRRKCRCVRGQRFSSSSIAFYRRDFWFRRLHLVITLSRFAGCLATPGTLTMFVAVALRILGINRLGDDHICRCIRNGGLGRAGHVNHQRLATLHRGNSGARQSRCAGRLREAFV